jgi:hypothetical protein
MERILIRLRQLMVGKCVIVVIISILSPEVHVSIFLSFLERVKLI